MHTLAVEKRDTKGASARSLRRAGTVPAVVYGAHQEALPIAVEARAFDKAFKLAGESAVIALEGLGATIPVLVQEVDLDPLTYLPRHIDFYAITKGEKVEVAVPLSFIGESAAVKAGANLIKVLRELEIEADPMNLPAAIEVDLTLLANLGDQIHASDLKLPAGVVLMIEPEEVVALVQEVVEEKEEAPVADLSAIEVEKKGKVEDAEGAGAAAEAKKE
jgi:large subunit ribosomal protein L25